MEIEPGIVSWTVVALPCHRLAPRYRVTAMGCPTFDAQQLVKVIDRLTMFALDPGKRQTIECEPFDGVSLMLEFIAFPTSALR